MEANIKSAQLLYKQNKYQETIETCNKILDTNNNSIEALKLIAQSFLETRRIEEARLYFNKALKIHPDDYEVIKDLGNTYQAIGDSNTAKYYYEKALRINKSYAPALTNLGGIELNIGDKQKALALLLKATKFQPHLATAWGNLANCYYQLKEPAEAAAACHKSLEINHNLFNSHFLLGTILLEQKQLKEAVLAFRKTVELKPDFFQAHLNLGALLKELGHLQEAEVSTRKAIQLNPNFAITHNNLGNILSDRRKLKDAEISYRKAIELNPHYITAYYNLGNILSDLGNLEDAEATYRKAIALNPDLVEAHSNLGNILYKIGKLRDAEISYLQTVKLNPDFTKAYYYLSLLSYSEDSQIWQDRIFSKSFLNNKLQKDKIDIYFARANILHKKRNYKESAKYLQLANQLKLSIKPSKSNLLIDQSKKLLIESAKSNINQKEHKNPPESLFIVGMPRSGSTLLESILSLNPSVDDLGEINILEESFIEWKKDTTGLTLSEIYWKKIIDQKCELNITTNKWLYNYQYVGIIAKNIINAKVIHCYRNPLDNILSIYRASFARGNEYSSSLVDCTKVYIDQEGLMNQYKDKFRSKIYDLDYDSLVSNPKQEIKALIAWLDWEWNDSYLSPHLNPRSVSTASSVEVRSPINSKSLGGWKNYKDMLNPAIQILTKTKKYIDIVS